MTVHIGNDWDQLLKEEWEKPYYQELRRLLIQEYKNFTILPEADRIFQALKEVPFEKTKLVLLGQDPYHGLGQANGLCFSVKKGIALPPSLENIFKEYMDDLGYPKPLSGDLSPWAKEGVLLLNATLTVRANQANSHRAIGWQQLTDEIIRLLGKREKPLVFLLWGRFAQSKEKYIASNHLVIKSPHPSPLSAYRGFFGSKPFSKSNAFLIENGQEPISWKLEA